MANLTVQSVVIGTTAPNGIAPTYAAAAGGGDTFTHPGDPVWVHVKNGHSSSQTVTIGYERACDQGFTHDAVAAVVNAGERIIPVPRTRFADASTGVVSITYSGVTALTVGVFRYVG